MKIEASSVSETTKRDAGVLESCVQRKFTPAPLWTEAMLAALQRGVKGGKWHSLIDKVWHPDTLMTRFHTHPFSRKWEGGLRTVVCWSSFSNFSSKTSWKT